MLCLSYYSNISLLSIFNISSNISTKSLIHASIHGGQMMGVILYETYQHLCFAIHSLIHLFIHSLSRSGTRGVLPFNDIQYLGIVKSFTYTFSFIHSLTIKELIQWSSPLWTKSSIQILLFIHSFVPLFIHPFIH